MNKNQDKIKARDSDLDDWTLFMTTMGTRKGKRGIQPE